MKTVTPDSGFGISREDDMTGRDLCFYAKALWDLMLATGWSDGHCKSYDPMVVERDGDHSGTYHSYVFDMKDGGRHHPIPDYAGNWDAADCILADVAEMMKPQAERRITGTYGRGVSKMNTATKSDLTA